MWWRSQNLEKPIPNAAGGKWHFRVWHDFVAGTYLQRVYFWNDERTETGVAEFTGNCTLNVTRLKQRIAKLAKDQRFRAHFYRPLSFPVERHHGGNEAGENRAT